MQEVYIVNDSDEICYVAGRSIAPKSGRLIPANEVPRHLLPENKKPEIPKENPLELLLRANVQTVSSGLSSLSDDELDNIETLELMGQDRKGVADAIASERLRRADLADKKTETLALLESGTAEQLMQQKAIVSEHDELVNLIDNRLAELSNEPGTN